MQSNTIIINTKSTAYIEEFEIRFDINGIDKIITSLDDLNKNYETTMKYLEGFENREKVISLTVDLGSLVSELMISPYSSKWQKKKLLP